MEPWAEELIVCDDGGKVYPSVAWEFRGISYFNILNLARDARLEVWDEDPDDIAKWANDHIDEVVEYIRTHADNYKKRAIMDVWDDAAREVIERDYVWSYFDDEIWQGLSDETLRRLRDEEA